MLNLSLYDLEHIGNELKTCLSKLTTIFFNRADAHIHLANDQLGDATRGTVSASLMYAASRFNAWRSACGFEKKEDMLAARAETIAYFVAEYEKCLTENLDDYIENFDRYMKPASEDGADDQ